MKKNKKTEDDYKKIVLFFVIVYLWTWLFWIPVSVLGMSVTSFFTQVLIALGGAGPSIWGVFFVLKYKAPHEVKNYFHRIWDFKRLNWSSWFFTIFLIPFLVLMSSLVDESLGGSGITFHKVVFFTKTDVPFIWALPYGFFFLICGPLSEELGWRGYVLELLQNRVSLWGGSLILGVLWFFWHLPLLVIYMELPFEHPQFINLNDFLFFGLGLVSVSVVISWLYIYTKKSIFAVILLHAEINFFTASFLYTNRVKIISILLLLVMFFVFIYGQKICNLVTRQKQS